MMKRTRYDTSSRFGLFACQVLAFALLGGLLLSCVSGEVASNQDQNPTDDQDNPIDNPDKPNGNNGSDGTHCDAECQTINNACLELQCQSDGYLGCDTTTGEPQCIGCNIGYYQDGTDPSTGMPICRAHDCISLACAQQNRLCVPDANSLPSCGGCIPETIEDAGHCREPICGELGCEEALRICQQTAFGAQCTGCLDGHQEDADGQCQPITCDTSMCEAIGRHCEQGENGAECGDCLDAFTETADGRCVECAFDSQCPQDAHCSFNGQCTQSCDSADAQSCGDGFVCIERSRCVATEVGGPVCGVGSLEGGTIRPVVMLLLDRSNSMDWYSFGDDDSVRRWDALNAALWGDDAIAGDGVIHELDNSIDFGMTLFSGTSAMPQCPFLISEPVAPDNASNLESVFIESGFGPWTPTGPSIDAAAQALAAIDTQQPKYLLLATDGKPHSCSWLADNDEAFAEGQTESLMAVQEAYALGIETFVLGIMLDNPHLQEMANAGRGLPPQGPQNATLYLADEGTELEDGLRAILASVTQCDVAIESSSDTLIAGQVYLDGEAISADPIDGWTLINPMTLRLNGQSCDQLKSPGQHRVWVEFGCGWID